MEPLAVKPNLASASMERTWAAFDALDLDAARLHFAPDFVWEDRRPIVGLSGGLDLVIASARERIASGARLERRTIIGTAGDRVAIARVLWAGGPPDGRFEVEILVMHEVNEAGLCTAQIFLDPDDERAAQREAWARWAAIDPVAAPWVELLMEITDAWNSRDRPRLRGRFDDDVVVEDHRHAGLGRIEGAEACLDSNVVLWELAPDQRLEVGWSWPAVDRHGLVVTQRRVGTLAHGGAFESEYVWLALARGGRLTRVELFEIEALDTALARFEDLRPPSADALPRGNAVTAALESWKLFDPGADLDWEALSATCRPDMIFEDRQGFARLSGDREMMIASLRQRVASGARPERTLLGALGERIVVGRMLWTGGPADGRFEIEYLSVNQVDEAGLVIAIILFAPADERAAQREAWSRWAAIDPIAASWVELMNEFTEAWNGHDRTRVRACLTDDFVLEDHRHAGLGRIEGAEAYVDSIVVLWDLAPEQRLMPGWSWPVIERHGIVVTVRRQGTVPDGGPFETGHFALGLARNGRFTRFEFFEIEALDTARARFEELRPDPLRIPPNASSRAIERFVAHFESGDWDALRALCLPIRFEDRRPLFRTSGDCGQFIVNCRFIRESGFRPLLTVLATAGDRLHLHRALWRKCEDQQMTEVESLEVFEVDTDGRICAGILFDPDDRDAAEAELFERYAAGGGDGMPRGMTEYFRGVNGRDLARARTGLCDDFVLEDRRRTGMGRLEGGDAYIASIAAGYELTGEVHVRPLYVAAIAAHGRVVMVRIAGTNTEGGAFETYFAAVVLYRNERIDSFEFFEPEELDTALARLAELRPDPLRIPPNAATRVQDRQLELAASGDWEGVQALHSPRLVFDDRRRGLRTTADGEAYRAGLRWASSRRPDTTHTVLATAGDRFELRLNRFTRTEAGTLLFEIETLALSEVDADGRLESIVIFDPEDRAAADAELAERFLGSSAHSMPPAVVEFGRAVNAHDLERARAALPDDFVLDDHRRIGLGRIEGADAYIASLAAYFEQSADARIGDLYQVADAAHGRVAVSRVSGTNQEGGAFETLYVIVVAYRDGRTASLEFFELDDLDAALARFEALRPQGE